MSIFDALVSDAPETAEVAPEKPALFADDRSDAERFDPRNHQGALDPSRIPGYSEQVQANDISQADDLIFREQNGGVTKEDMYRRIGCHPKPLPVEYMWLRVSAAGGGESSSALRELDTYQNQKGFRLAKEEDITRYGYGFPPAARLAEDGTIRRGPDVALFVRSGEVAKMWRAHEEQMQKEFEGAAKEPSDLFVSRTGETRSGKAVSGYDAPTFVEPERHETVTVKH